MLNDEDVIWLMKQIAATAELLGQSISPVAVELMTSDLEHYPRAALAAALKRVRTECTGRLTPKVIIEAIDAAMGRPGANEAWATALPALDGRNTVVWTEEIAKAWDVAYPLVHGGDEIGGRMAFKEAYERLVRTARDERRVPVIVISQGSDSALRAVAVEKAVQLGYLKPKNDQEMADLIREAQVGYLKPEDAAAYLPAPKASAIDPLLLLAGDAGAIPADAPPEVRERLMQLRAEFASSKKRHAEAMAQRAADAAADLAARKAAVNEAATSHPDYIDPAAALRAAEWAATAPGTTA